MRTIIFSQSFSGWRNNYMDSRLSGYRTFRVGFNADGASVYRASLAFIFFEKIYKGGQNVLVKSLKTLANTGEIGFYFFIRT